MDMDLKALIFDILSDQQHIPTSMEDNGQHGHGISEEVSRIAPILVMLRRRQDEFDTEQNMLLRRIRADRRQRAIKLKQERRQRAKERRRKRIQLYYQYYTECVKKVWTRVQPHDWWENTAKNYSDEQWLQDFRVSRKTFSYICGTLKPALKRQDTAFRLCITLEKRVAIGLYKLATTLEYSAVAKVFGVGKTTVVTCTHTLYKAVNQLLRPKLIPPPNHAKLAEMADCFEARFGIPQCVGAIDASHIPTRKLSEHPAGYRNGKGWDAIILQAVVDAKGMLWDLNIGQPGGEDDAQVLRKSNIWALASASDTFSGRVQEVSGTNVGYFLLGNSAYPLQSWLLKPYPETGRLTESQELYNVRTSRAHRVAEHAFGRLKGRWRSLSQKNVNSLNGVVDMVEACCTLHNLCELNMDPFLPEWDFPEGAVRPRPGRDNTTCDIGSAARCALQKLFTEEQCKNISSWMTFLNQGKRL